MNTTLAAGFAALTCLFLAVMLGLPGDIGPLLNGAVLWGRGRARGGCLWRHRGQARGGKPRSARQRALALAPCFAGVLAGAVSITASCALVQAYAAAIIGVIGGCVYMGASLLLQR